MDIIKRYYFYLNSYSLCHHTLSVFFVQENKCVAGRKQEGQFRMIPKGEADSGQDRE
jgi:hypothetical protein